MSAYFIHLWPSEFWNLTKYLRIMLNNNNFLFIPFLSLKYKSKHINIWRYSDSRYRRINHLTIADLLSFLYMYSLENYNKKIYDDTFILRLMWFHMLILLIFCTSIDEIDTNKLVLQIKCSFIRTKGWRWKLIWFSLLPLRALYLRSSLFCLFLNGVISLKSAHIRTINNTVAEHIQSNYALITKLISDTTQNGYLFWFQTSYMRMHRNSPELKQQGYTLSILFTSLPPTTSNHNNTGDSTTFFFPNQED